MKQFCSQDLHMVENGGGRRTFGNQVWDRGRFFGELVGAEGRDETGQIATIATRARHGSIRTARVSKALG